MNELTTIQGTNLQGRFYEPQLNLNKGKGLDLMETLIQIRDLRSVDSEKEIKKNLKVTKDLWHKDTLFGLIARMGAGYKNEAILKKYLNFTHLVCGDLNSELADFIGLDTIKQRVVFIHAKAKNHNCQQVIFRMFVGRPQKTGFSFPIFCKASGVQSK